MPIDPKALLIAEIGSAMTRVTLVDAVDGETRLIGQAEVPSSIEPPTEDPSLAILEATVQISELTGRRLLVEDGLLMPQNAEQDGVDGVVIVTSATRPLSLVIAAISGDVSARSALHASRATYTHVQQVITLNETGAEARGDSSWIERQVQILLGLRPDAVLIAGGVEGGAQAPLVRLAHIVGLTAANTRPDGQAGLRSEPALLPVIFAGNSACRDRVIEALSGKCATYIVENVRPSLETERLEPTRRELSRLYVERMLPHLPGIATLRRLSSAPIRLGYETSAVMTRFFAERYKRNVLLLDLGASNTSLFLQSRGRFSPAILGGIGVGYGAGAVLAARGPQALLRWLPFPITEQDLVHRVLNKMLRPHIVPSTREALLIEYAIAREALRLALDALLDERPEAAYDMVVASGGMFAHTPHPGLAVLALLDALQPTGEESLFAIDLHLDSLGLVGACGALAFSDADAALTLFEHDLLNNTPLATCVVALGHGRLGNPALEAELQIVGGGKETVSVAHGQIGRLPLAPGRRGTLTIKPGGGVRIGNNAPGQTVSTDVAAVSGSALGVIVDARGRPLQLPSNPSAHRALLWEWLVALGAEHDPSPYPADAPPTEPAHEPVPAPQPAPPAPEPGPPPPAAEAAPQPGGINLPPAEPEPPSIESDLAKLRQTVAEEPEKKGFFRRKPK